MLNKLKFCILAGVAFASITAPGAAADSITIAEWGGASQAADREAFFEPFTKETGIRIVDDVWQGDMATILTQVQTKSYKWSLVRGESALVQRGCDQGILMKFDASVIGTAAEYLPGAFHPCGIAYATFSSNIAYNADKLKDNPPTSVQDFFDLTKYPGKRGIRRNPVYVLELALLADGVSRKDLYKVLRTPEGVDRAFKKLDTIKDQIVWWESGAQPPQLLADGEVVMSTVWGNRIAAAQKEGKNLQIMWDGSGLDYDWFIMPKDSPDAETSIKFIHYIRDPKNAARLSSVAPFGPALKAALPLVNENDLAALPTSPENSKGAFPFDSDFYADNQEDLLARLTNWLQK
ncbi:MAG: ABC transporter substrate-binding protein [Mesorhizobium sp.]|uniref:ABC transporter substrate-binding protein n=1 Tax=Mesorhizobium sp. TaxID=1871066 RepID=UPI001218ECE1|nr:ABC transporter substrate-binding protein [Mesorhizobium sp.]TIP30746.1 MAG: ABC transporter substrate-binding protein [Mesorhizobium sp.]